MAHVLRITAPPVVGAPFDVLLDIDGNDASGAPLAVLGESYTLNITPAPPGALDRNTAVVVVIGTMTTLTFGSTAGFTAAGRFHLDVEKTSAPGTVLASLDFDVVAAAGGGGGGTGGGAAAGGGLDPAALAAIVAAAIAAGTAAAGAARPAPAAAPAAPVPPAQAHWVWQYAEKIAGSGALLILAAFFILLLGAVAFLFWTPFKAMTAAAAGASSDSGYSAQQNPGSGGAPAAIPSGGAGPSLSPTCSASGACTFSNIGVGAPPPSTNPTAPAASSPGATP